MSVPRDEVPQGLSAEVITPGPRKDGICRLSGALLQPASQDADRSGQQRRGSLLPALAGAVDVRSGSKMDVGEPETRQLAGAQAGLDCREQECVVASTDPSGAVWCFKQRLGLELACLEGMTA